MIKKHINRLRGFHVDDQISIINISSSTALLKLCALLHINNNEGYHLFQLLCCTDKKLLYKSTLQFDFINDLIIKKWNENNNNYKDRCAKCSFYNLPNNSLSAIIDLQDRYKLLTFNQCTNIINNCCF